MRRFAGALIADEQTQAQAVGMDPLEFRLRNYAEVEPISGKPFSSKALRECYTQGAACFGWQGRPLAPREMRDENGLLVGWGLGTATFPVLLDGRRINSCLALAVSHDGAEVLTIVTDLALLDQTNRAHDLAGCAEAALECVMGDKGRLHRVRGFALRQPQASRRRGQVNPARP